MADAPPPWACGGRPSPHPRRRDPASWPPYPWIPDSHGDVRVAFVLARPVGGGPVRMAVAPSPGRPVGGSHLPPWKALGGGQLAAARGQLAAAGRPSLYGGGRPLGIASGPPSVCPPRSGPAGAGGAAGGRARRRGRPVGPPGWGGVRPGGGGGPGAGAMGGRTFPREASWRVAPSPEWPWAAARWASAAGVASWRRPGRDGKRPHPSTYIFQSTFRNISWAGAAGAAGPASWRPSSPVGPRVENGQVPVLRVRGPVCKAQFVWENGPTHGPPHTEPPPWESRPHHRTFAHHLRAQLRPVVLCGR